jgi:hypothetical protein
MESTWPGRDLPVLRAIVEIDDRTGESLTPDDLTRATGIAYADVARALRALASERPPFFEYSTVADGSVVIIANPTGHARRTVGQWPTPEDLADQIITALEDAATNASSEEERSRARKMLDGAKGIGKGVLTGVLIKVLTQGV